ncbi:MAG: Rid family detoxifying hydrolase [Pseudomonadota bacterium]
MKVALLTVAVAVLGSIGATAQSLPFSRIIEANGVLYIAGHLGTDPETGTLVEGGIEAQTRQTLENIGATLATVDASHADIVRCQVFLADIRDFSAMNGVYRTFFPTTPPARTTVAVSGLARDAAIEIECTAVRGHGLSKEEE